MSPEPLTELLRGSVEKTPSVRVPAGLRRLSPKDGSAAARLGDIQHPHPSKHTLNSNNHHGGLFGDVVAVSFFPQLQESDMSSLQLPLLLPRISFQVLRVQVSK